MTLFKPTLKVNRLVVFQGGHKAFDGVFHQGVNVIRGRNSSGKTTLMDLLAFSLGAENIRWKPEALLCSRTMVEVSLNGKAACLQRDISQDPMRPMYIFWGPITDAFDAGPQRWDVYPFKRSSEKISFSQVIFNALEMQQAKSDESSNLTLHQILRVLYADQPSVHSPIFRFDKYDGPLVRDMVGNYLCGGYDDELYSSQLRLREVDDLLSKRVSELKSIFNVLGSSGHSDNIDFNVEKIQNIEMSYKRMLQKLEDLKQKREADQDKANKSKEITDGLRKQLNEAKKRESKLTDELALIEFDIGDSVLFLKELEARLINLDESKEARSYFGTVVFHFCPVCLSELEDSSEEDNCRLCKSKLLNGKSDVQLLRMRNELTIQIGESKSLIEEREKRAQELRRDIPKVVSELRELSQKYLSQSASWSTDLELEIEDASRMIGVLEMQLKQARDNEKLASIIDELKRSRTELSGERSDLGLKITSLEKQQEMRIREIVESIGNDLIRLLKLDLPLQPEFVNAREVKFDFAENAVYVNGVRNFSESSTVVLRHLFHLALLASSVSNQFMRLPRFIMLDGIDDGGMEVSRSHRLQEIIIEECEKYDVEFQLIFATSEINPKFEDSDFVVGRHFNPDIRSLNIGTIF